MERNTHISLIQRVFDHLDGGTTDLAPDISRNPVAAFTSADRLDREVTCLFRQQPMLACLSGRLPEPGSYLAQDLVGVPLLLMRGADGVARAFLNSCRHRGVRLLDGDGTVRSAVACPYHGWAYGPDGRLKAVPHADAFDGFDIAACSLQALPCTEADGLIWVQLIASDIAGAGQSIDPARCLGDLAHEFASYGFGGFHHYASRVMEPAINWKMAIDTFLEPYHFAVLHKQTVAPIFHPNLCLFDEAGHNFREYLPRRSISEARQRPEADWDAVWHAAVVYYLFPNTIFVMQQEHAEIWRMFPKNGQTGQAEVYLDFYIPEPATSDSARRHWDANIDLTVRTVEHEDFAISESAYQGMASGLSTDVIYGRNEPALAAFHRTIAAAVGADLE